jgi:hypothetical protein
MDIIKLIASMFALVSSIMEFIAHKEANEKCLLWLILFWAMIK